MVNNEDVGKAVGQYTKQISDTTSDKIEKMIVKAFENAKFNIKKVYVSQEQDGLGFFGYGSKFYTVELEDFMKPNYLYKHNGTTFKGLTRINIMVQNELGFKTYESLLDYEKKNGELLGFGKDKFNFEMWTFTCSTNGSYRNYRKHTFNKYEGLDNYMYGKTLESLEKGLLNYAWNVKNLR